MPTAETLEKALPPQTGPSLGMLAIIGAKSDEHTKIKRLTLPPIIKPSQVGIGVAIQGRVIRIVPSPVATYKSELIVMRHESSGQEFCFPATAVIIGALASEQGVDRKAVDLKKSIGLNLIIKGLGVKAMDGKSSDGKRDRTVNLFEVFVIDE